MGMDYYKMLGVDRSAKDDHLKKAYRKISEAYEVTTVILAISPFLFFWLVSFPASSFSPLSDW